jgi:hypothetical protein
MMALLPKILFVITDIYEKFEILTTITANVQGYSKMIVVDVVEVGRAHVITFLPLSCELSVLSLSLSFFR